MNAACCFGKAGNTKEAARAYKKAFLMDPKNGALFQNFWTVYGADKKRQNEGIQILKTLVAARSSAALPLYYLGFLNQALGKKAEARKAFEKVVKSKEGQKFSSAWVRLGEIYYKEDGDEKKSERHMVKALEQNPRDEKASEFLQFLATRAKNRRDMTRFVEIIKKILKYQPENGQVWNHLAWHYHSRRQLREALKYYEKAVKFAPNDAIIQTGLGKAYNDLNENAAAEACFKKAIAIDPEHVDALMNLGWFYRKHGKLEKAKALFERILEIDPGQMRIRRDLEGIKRRLEK